MVMNDELEDNSDKLPAGIDAKKSFAEVGVNKNDFGINALVVHGGIARVPQLDEKRVTEIATAGRLSTAIWTTSTASTPATTAFDKINTKTSLQQRV